MSIGQPPNGAGRGHTAVRKQRACPSTASAVASPRGPSDSTTGMDVEHRRTDDSNSDSASKRHGRRRAGADASRMRIGCEPDSSQSAHTPRARRWGLGTTPTTHHHRVNVSHRRDAPPEARPRPTMSPAHRAAEDRWVPDATTAIHRRQAHATAPTAARASRDALRAARARARGGADAGHTETAKAARGSSTTNCASTACQVGMQ
jgi:hypothetical protein